LFEDPSLDMKKHFYTSAGKRGYEPGNEKWSQLLWDKVEKKLENMPGS